MTKSKVASLDGISLLDHYPEILQKQDESLLASEMARSMLESVDLQPFGGDAEKSGKDAITLDDVCKSYQSSEHVLMTPMERWTMMAVDDECFPLLAKRSMQDAGLDIATLQSPSSPHETARRFPSGEEAAIAGAIGVRRNVMVESTVDDELGELIPGERRIHPRRATGSHVKHPESARI